MKGFILSALLALSAGLLGAVQGAINSHIGKTTGQLTMVVGVSLTQAILGSILLFQSGWNGIPVLFLPWILIAGILGVAIMFGVSSSISSIGALSVFILVILGQIVASTLIDHFGAFGSPRLPVTPQKIVSILIIILGTCCLLKSS